MQDQNNMLSKKVHMFITLSYIDVFLRYKMDVLALAYMPEQKFLLCHGLK